MADGVKTHAAFIWSVADLLRGTYKQSDYGKVILPLVVIRRLDCVLDPTKDAVLEKAKSLKGKVENVEPVLRSVAGQQFYNTSPLDVPRLLDDPNNVADNLRSYIGGFSEAAPSDHNDPQEPLILHWDGTSWSSMPVPSVPGWPLWLYDVEAVAVDDVWAVGFTTVGATDEPLILHWDGGQWSRVLDGVQPAARQLGGVSASSSSDVWAVGRDQRWAQPSCSTGTGAAGRGMIRSDLPSSSGGLSDVTTLPDGETWVVGHTLDEPFAMHLCPGSS